jgi:hypothetical protein
LSVWSRRNIRTTQRIRRFEGEQLVPGGAVAPSNAGGLLVATMDVDAEHEKEFNDWYNQEHVPQLGAVPGVLCARRYRMSGEDTGRKYLALYHMTGPEVSRSAAWRTAADTEWTRRLRPHFRAPLVRRCRRYVRRD